MVRSVWWQGLARWFAVLIAAAATAVAGGAASADSAAGSAVRVRVVYEPKANPPRMLGEGTAIDWEKPGLTLELLRLVGARTGVQFAYERVPWKRGLFLIEANEADAIFHTSFVPERMDIMVYPMKGGQPDAGRAVFVQNYMLYKRAGTPVVWDGAALAGADVPVGATSNYSVVGDLKRLGVPVEVANTSEQSLDKLLSGRIAAYAGLEAMTDAVLAGNPAKYGKLVKLTPPLVSKPYHLTFSRGFYTEHRDVAERIWDAIAAVNASAEFAAIVHRYVD
ncbi:substrate-binding periplasmic protein [Azospirillum sp. sgz301742]